MNSQQNHSERGNLIQDYKIMLEVFLLFKCSLRLRVQFAGAGVSLERTESRTDKRSDLY